MKRIGTLLLFFVVVFSAFSQENRIVSSQVQFKISNAEIEANGRFEEMETHIFFDPNQLEKTRFAGKILVKSIKTGIRLRDQHLKKPLYFNEPAFPAIDIQLVSLQNLGRQKFQGTFSIRIKGIEKQQNIPFTYTLVNGNYVFTGNFLVNRRDFKVGGQSWTLAEYANVSVRFEVSPL